jgi:hypothetical protein
MESNAGVWVELGFILFAFFVLAPSIAAAIGYAAWKGWPKSFDREMYWTVFVASGAVAGLVIVYALRIRPVGGAWLHLVQLTCLGLGALLFGVALGFGVGIFTRRRNSLTQGPPE